MNKRLSSNLLGIIRMKREGIEKIGVAELLWEIREDGGAVSESRTS